MLPRFIRYAAVLSVLALGAGCSGRYMDSAIIAPDAQIVNSSDHREVVEVMEHYEDAMERMDLDALFALLSLDYYENAGTTDTSEDDYGYARVTEVFQTLLEHVEDVRIEVSIRDIQVVEDRADVLYEFALTMLYAIGEESHWETARDVNRLQLQREDGDWRIVSGL